MNNYKTVPEIESTCPASGPYLRKAATSLLQTAALFDLARSADYLMTHPKAPEESQEMEPPYFLLPNGERMHGPAILRISKETSVAATILMGHGNITKSSIPALGNTQVAAIARMSVIEQFEIFKNFGIPHGIPTNKKQVKKYKTELPTWILPALTEIIERRNNLVHDLDYQEPTAREAVDTFYSLSQMFPEFLKNTTNNT